MAALRPLGIRILTVYLRLGEGRVESFPGGYLILQKALAGSQVVCSNILLPRCYSFPHVSIHKPFEKSSKVNLNWRWNAIGVPFWGEKLRVLSVLMVFQNPEIDFSFLV